MNETSLVAAAKSGETAAFDHLFIAHKEKLFRTVLRTTRNRQDAEDAMQDSLLRAFLHVKSFKGHSAFSTWLTRIGINSALMTLRRNRKYREVSADDRNHNKLILCQADGAPDPEQRYAQQERAKILRKTIAKLRSTIGRPMELHALQGYSIKEMAEEIGVSVSTAKGRLFHAKAALRNSKSLRSIRDRDRRYRVSNPVDQLRRDSKGVEK